MQLEPDVFADQTANHLANIPDHDVQVEQVRLQNLLATERQQLSCENSSSRGRALDFGNLLCARIAGTDSRGKGLRIAGDDREQIVEVVGHAAGQLSKGFHLRRLAALL